MYKKGVKGDIKGNELKNKNECEKKESFEIKEKVLSRERSWVIENRTPYKTAQVVGLQKFCLFKCYIKE